MMILGFFGDDAVAQEKVVAQLERAVKDFNIDHINNDRRLLSAEQKIGRVQRLVASRNRRDTVTVVTGITEVMEYQMLMHSGAVFCVLPGVLPSILSRGYIPIDETFLYVTHSAAALNTEAKRRVYMTPEEAFSECYRREMRLSKKGKRS
ncbi:hypothetical protein [Citrobacter amalonaticus]|uniref:hypothetical protein n=1 Tax=Citrobacter amalonaticus TaxID=35703 RepID=UPI000B66C0D0|nr:hypothetical protein [Citrobacter amalonaticus]OUE50293.1 hypothetical protein AZ012_004686 [Citrobacter amalonaticus]